MRAEKKTEEWAQLYCDGKTLQQIADAYGVSRQWVHQVLKPLNIPPNTREAVVRQPGPRNGRKIWSVYVMAAPANDELTYFKVGISSDIVKRLCQMQCGCPLRITSIWAITTFNNGAAQDLESKLHALLWSYRSNGEWFAMKTNDLTHKRAMNEAFAYGVRACSNMAPVKWRKMQVPELRKAVRDATRERNERELTPGRHIWIDRPRLDNWPA